ncbi:MAG: glycosyltransferase [Paludibacter sp.]|nr:glycosyltransferase [Paludibacter sp.]
MISITTAIYNQLDMNKLFWSYLKKYTDSNFELIIIDNHSTDGSREFFESLSNENVIIISNNENYSYPHCQNQGIRIAKYEYLVFLNNDLLVSPHWDSRMLQVLGKDNQDVVSFGTNDRLVNRTTSKKIQKRWKRIKYPIITIFGQRTFSLKLMTFLCYGNWEKFTDRIFSTYGLTLTEGFSGSAIAMNRAAIEKIGEWDITQQGADFDIFYRTCNRSETNGDIKPLAVINGVFMHHFRRLTLYNKYPPFADAANLRSIQEKWGNEKLSRWLKIVNFE